MADQTSSKMEKILGKKIKEQEQKSANRISTGKYLQDKPRVEVERGFKIMVRLNFQFIIRILFFSIVCRSFLCHGKEQGIKV